ncbi:Hypothetical predicted protein, partial [Mytilus galloprovincialis]
PYELYVKCSFAGTFLEQIHVPVLLSIHILRTKTSFLNTFCQVSHASGTVA